MSANLKYQPMPLAPMDVKEASSYKEEREQGHCRGAHESRGCRHAGRQHARSAARFSFAAIVTFALLLFVTFKCRLDEIFFGSGSGNGLDTWSGMMHNGKQRESMMGGGLEKRQSTGGSVGNGNDGSQSSFVKNKLYLIIVFVGLFLCLVFAIMLAAWCCRGSFENPLCCPCYLCACCGGLACIECIGCGLCAEGVEDLNF